jgi:hypothetical protein
MIYQPLLERDGSIPLSHKLIGIASETTSFPRPTLLRLEWLRDERMRAGFSCRGWKASLETENAV